jgi:hypothetical protein
LDNSLDEVELNANEQSIYRAKIGSIAYAARNTRYELQFIVGFLARHVSAPKVKHMKAIDRVLKYIALNKSRKLLFDFSKSKDADCNIIIYTDADWASDTSDRKSTTGWLLTIDGNAIIWQSKKQHTVAQSTAEAEYYALGDGTKEALFLKQWFNYYYPMNINNQTIPLYITLKSDNNGAILMADHPTDHNRTKHIDIKYHFIREHIHNKSIKIEYVDTANQLADILTKTVKPAVFKNLVNIISKENINSVD